MAGKIRAKAIAKEEGKTLSDAREILGATIGSVAGHINVDFEEAGIIVEKAISGGESDLFRLEEWYEKRFVPNTIFIDEQGYSEMCIDALKILGTTAGTDYGSSRQRDMGQLWADMTRGYLGELAFKIFLKEKYGIEIELGHEVGQLEEYLPADIHGIKNDDGSVRQPGIRIGIKATKWNGIWFDLPGDQFNHSDAHVLVKVGTGRDHLFAYFKKISVFKDKVLQKGKDIGLLSESEADSLYDSLPTFKPIPAYICGFASVQDEYTELDYKGKKGRKNYTITEWRGSIKPGDLEGISRILEIEGKITFEGIGTFSHDKGYLFNAGSLRWQKNDWDELIKLL